MTWMVLGAGISGLAAAKLLKAKGYGVVVCDKNQLSEDKVALLTSFGISYTNQPSNKIPNNIDEGVVLSPGVPLTHPAVIDAKKNGLKVLSEVEFALSFFSGKIVSITGTNGKSTTASMTYHIFKKSGYRVALAGNIGHPVSDVILSEPHPEILVLELSSYQLEHSSEIKSEVGAFINFSPDHLDRHKTIKNYFAAKWKICGNISPQSTFLLDKDVHELAKKFGFKQPHKRLTIVERESYQKSHHTHPVLKHWHNQHNAHFASRIVSCLTKKSPKELYCHLNSFNGLPHRCEIIGQSRNKIIVNDSKATNVNSTYVALSNLNEPNLVFMGGLGKNESFKSLLEFRDKIESLILFGPEGPFIQKELSNISSVVFPTLKEALDFFTEKHSKQHPIKNPILFSPGCASFDEFNNFEHRGEYFKKRVSQFLKATD